MYIEMRICFCHIYGNSVLINFSLLFLTVCSTVGSIYRLEYQHSEIYMQSGRNIF